MNGTTDQIMNGTTDKQLLEELNNKFAIAVRPVTVWVGVQGVCGLFGNLLVLYVYMFHYKKCNFKYFVLCLALTDLTASLTTIPAEIVTQLFVYNYQFPILCKIKTFFNVVTISAEALCLLAIDIERYLKVCWPLKRQIKPFVAKVMCCLVFTFAALLSLPVTVLWGTHSYNKTYLGRNITVTVCEKDEDFLFSVWPFVYFIALESFLSICLVGMFILYIFVAKKLILGLINTNTKSRKQNLQMDKFTSFSNKSTGETELSSYDLSTHPEIGSEQHESSIDKIKNRRLADYVCNTPSIPDLKQQGISIKQRSEKNQKATTESPKLILPDIKLSNEMKLTTKKSRTKSSDSDVSTLIRRNTLIMLILTVVFILTTVMYLTLASFIGRPGFLENLSDGQKSWIFFFFSLNFMNHVINPVIYGFLDREFKKFMKQKLCSYGKK